MLARVASDIDGGIRLELCAQRRTLATVIIDESGNAHRRMARRRVARERGSRVVVVEGTFGCYCSRRNAVVLLRSRRGSRPLY